MTNKPPPAVSKYKKTFEQKFAPDVADTRDDQTAIKTWGAPAMPHPLASISYCPMSGRVFPIPICSAGDSPRPAKSNLNFPRG